METEGAGGKGERRRTWLVIGQKDRGAVPRSERRMWPNHPDTKEIGLLRTLLGVLGSGARLGVLGNGRPALENCGSLRKCGIPIRNAGKPLLSGRL